MGSRLIGAADAGDAKAPPYKAACSLLRSASENEVDDLVQRWRGLLGVLLRDNFRVTLGQASSQQLELPVVREESIRNFTGELSEASGERLHAHTLSLSRMRAAFSTNSVACRRECVRWARCRSAP